MSFEPDFLICSFNGEVGNRSIFLQVEGSPIPQLRLKYTKRNCYHDPSGRMKQHFRNATSAVMTHMGILICQFFPINMQVGVKLVYVVPRPNYLFIGNDRASGVVKPQYHSRNINYNNKQGDIDNFVKFTLDSISRRLILMNDKQVVRIEATKMFEKTNEGGLTVVDVYEWHQNDVKWYEPICYIN